MSNPVNNFSFHPPLPSSEKEEATDSVLEQDNLDLPPIAILSDDVLGMIFNLATQGGKDQETLLDIREVSWQWHNVVDAWVIGPCWGKLQKQCCNTALHPAIHQIHAQADDLEKAPLLNRIHSLSFSYFARFSYLTEALRKQGAPIPNCYDILGFEPRSYHGMQKKIDFSLQAAWKRISRQIDFEGALVPANAGAIRAWFDDPAHQAQLEQVKKLNLADAPLTAYPSEIFKLARLKELHFNSNRLICLPSAIGALTQLTELDLSYNEFTTLPKAIGDLVHLQLLSLSSNKLSKLPKSIGNLTQLRWLYLDNNRLSKLPKQLGNLVRLTELTFYTNQLTSLPKTVLKLLELQTLEPHGNPLLFLFDCNLDQPEVNELISPIQFTQKYLSCSTYECRSELARFCQQVHCGKDLATLNSTFEKLSEHMQQQIFQTWANRFLITESPSEIKEDLLANRKHLIEAVILTIRKKLRSLPDEQLKVAYAQIATLARNRKAGPKWGKRHAADNIIRFIDAIALTNESTY